MREAAEGAIFVLVFFVGLFLGVCVIGTGVSYKACGQYQAVTGRETEFGFWTGCFVRDGGEWHTRDEYEAMIIAREGLEGRSE